MYLRDLLLCILLFFSVDTMAQTWDKTYLIDSDGTYPYDCALSGRGSIIVGQRQTYGTTNMYPFAIKLDPNGNIQWSQNSFASGWVALYPLACTQQINGNTILALNATGTYAFGLQVLSPAGNTISQNIIGTSHPVGEMKLLATADNGYYFNYDLDSTSINTGINLFYTADRSYIERFDSNRVLLWRHLFHFQHSENYPSTLFDAGDTHIDVQKSFISYDGGLVYPILWDTVFYSSEYYKYSIQKLNVTGNIVWTVDLQTILNPLGLYRLSLNKIFETSDSGFVATIDIADTGNNNTNPGITHILKFNRLGAVTDTLSLPPGCWLDKGVETSTHRLLFAAGCGPVDFGYNFYDLHLHFMSYMPSPFSYAYAMLPNIIGGAFLQTFGSSNSGTVNYMEIINFDSLFNTYPSSVSGTAVLDKNHDCNTNNIDLRIKNNLVSMTDTQSNQWFAFTNDTGHYRVNVPAGRYTLAHEIYGYKAAECPAPSALTYNITTPAQYANVNLYDTLIPNKSNLVVSMYNFYFVPGFDNTMYVNVNNDGTVTGNTTLTFIKDHNIQFLSSTPAPTSVTGDTLRYTVSGLEADSALGFTINLHTPATAVAGQPLSFYASAPFVNDLNPADNVATLSDTIVSSYDPNEKTVNKPLHYDPNTGEMVYAVEFQNTGTYYAKNVVVVDSIDSHLDMSTFRLIAGAPFKPAISWWAGNRLLFTYNNIMLPDSVHNPKGSIGSFAYGIKPKANVKVGDTICNRAYIYFDYNKAVVTNATMNIVSKKPSAVPEVMHNDDIAVYPNPSAGSFTILLPAQAGSGVVEMMDMAGREVLCKYTLSGNKILLDTNAPTGMYLLQVMQADTKQTIIKKITVIR